MKKIYLSRFFKIIAVILSVLIFFSVAQSYIFINFDSDKLRVEGFYKEEENSLDVVFLGASDVFSGYSAGRAYEKYGFTSYPLATYQNPVSLYKTQIEEILKYQSPQQIVIEVNGILYDDELLLSEAGLRRYFDNTPLSANKVKSIHNLVPQEDFLSYLFPFIKYHSQYFGVKTYAYNIKELLTFRNKETSELKGLFTSTSIELSGTPRDVSSDYNCYALSNLSKSYLTDFLEYLNNNNIDNVVFVRFPHRIVDDDSYKRYMRSNETEKIVKEYGFDFINCERLIDEIGIDYDKSFYDNEHMSIYGEIKLTDYLGKVLTEEYKVSNKGMSEKQKVNWDNTARYTQLFFEYADKCITEGDSKWLNESIGIMNILKSMK